MADRPLTAFIVLDVNMPDHRKIRRLSPAARWLFVSSIAYSRRLLTDGFLELDEAERLAAASTPKTPKMRSKNTENDIQKLVGEVVAAGLWKRRRAGYTINDYADYQQTRSDVEAASLRAKSAAERRWKAHAERNADRNAVGNASRNAKRNARARVKEEEEESPKPPNSETAKPRRRSRAAGTSPRTTGTNERATGTSPRQQGTNPKRTAKAARQLTLAARYLETQLAADADHNRDDLLEDLRKSYPLVDAKDAAELVKRATERTTE